MSGLGDSDQRTIIGVHVLTEFIFCPRAGLVALGQQAEDSGEERRPGRLDYLPRYDLRNIEDAMQRTLKQIGWLSAGLLGVCIGALVLAWPLGRWGIWLGVLGSGAVLVMVIRKVVDFVRLTERRMAARKATGREPTFSGDNQPVPFDWWELRRAGFTAARYEAALRDEQLRMAGRPYLFCTAAMFAFPFSGNTTRRSGFTHSTLPAWPPTAISFSAVPGFARPTG